MKWGAVVFCELYSLAKGIYQKQDSRVPVLSRVSVATAMLWRDGEQHQESQCVKPSVRFS